MSRRLWTRDETLVALNIYCRTPFGKLHARNPEIIQAANALSRTPNALAMKCCNLAAFDESLQARGIRGLRKSSELDEQIWHEFEAQPERTAFEAEEAYAGLMHQPMRTSDEVEWEDVVGLDKVSVTKVRVNQHFFRALILSGYQSQCAVCELPFVSLLVASHIVPWSIDNTLRMNPRNGICLCTLHDKAFDKGLIHFSRDYVISLHPTVATESHAPAVVANFTRFAGQSLQLPDRWHPDPAFLERHSQILATTPHEGCDL